MTVFAFTNGHIVTPGGILEQAAIEVIDGRIASIAPDAAADTAINLDGGWIVPGFIDTQVNGGAGVLFNDSPDVEGIAAIGRAHARYGTTAFLPTLISDTPEIVARALDATDAAIEAGVPGVIGVHIEGPVISVTRKGIHDADKFRRLDDDFLALLTRPRRGKVMLTLAPEMVSLEDIATLHKAGVILSIGHSDADYETAKAAIAAGMTGVTHLYNAMSPLLHRAPGVVGASIEDQAIYCGLILDGFHVHDAPVRIAMRARPLDRFLLVTDAMPCVGADVAEFDLHGRRILVEGGRCLGEDGTLAGSSLDMAGAFRNAVNRIGLSHADAAMMAATSPAAFLGLGDERGALAPGLAADWVQLTSDLMPAGTWIAGNRIA
ncbi:N-acetylglucosamine-6-phosphate deacetylase [Sphingomonas kyeonggiensis]|uniref:N-acetylglucosamine-6-phosphate deacetylase n=1 Tax=Sphingomonas kyeonggiensis TaxID=1268553 RepID=A0A7W7NSH1_9SPHN|nr:N-acetylglucosamine-6-phosphate deacetylase [Sphingomonas kyeonggiensis]MBB4838624.1 N-acetylglucosamine-6-phosphate deacetylase [Sphingomonas kyeonggiensis]